MRRKKSFFKGLEGGALYIITVAALTYMIITFVGQRTKVSGSSMEPALLDGDNLIVDKLTYRFTDPKRYEIIVFPYRQKRHIYYIKRIIGLPGETIQILEGKVYINGEELSKDYGKEPMAEAGIAAEPIKLGEDEYFVLGDNRNNSSDSRKSDVGVVKRKELLGRALIRIWPIDRFGAIRYAE